MVAPASFFATNTQKVEHLCRDATWQLARGKLGSALQSAGIDDYVGISFALDLKDVAFGVFAWIKGRALG